MSHYRKVSCDAEMENHLIKILIGSNQDCCHNQPANPISSFFHSTSKRYRVLDGTLLLNQ